MATTIYIAPALTSQAGQCRIYSLPRATTDAGKEYRKNPGQFTEIGIMNSQGRLVCCAIAFHELKDMEPLAAGMQVSMDELMGVPAL